MITTAIAVSTDGTVILGAGPTYGILLAILIVHGLVCSSATRILARLNLFYGFLMSRCNSPLSVTRGDVESSFSVHPSSRSDRGSYHSPYSLLGYKQGIYTNGLREV